MKRIARMATLVALLVLPAAALAGSGSGQVWVPACNKAVYKPTRLLLACGDGTNYLAKLKWQRWTERTAKGTGIDEVDDCMPDCAGGHFQSYAVTVTLSRPKRCTKVRRHRVFSHAVLDYPAAHPGRNATVSMRLSCPF